MAVLVLCPSLGRPGNAAALTATFVDTTSDPETELLFVVEVGDPTRSDYPTGRTIVVPGGGSMIPALNAGLAPFLAGPWTAFAFVGDDHRFATLGWDRMVDEALISASVAYGDDGNGVEGLPTAWFVAGDVVRALGWLASPVTAHYYCDNIWGDLARATASLRYLPGFSIPHLHHSRGLSTRDGTYQHSRKFLSDDRARYEAYRASPAHERDVRLVAEVLERRASADAGRMPGDACDGATTGAVAPGAVRDRRPAGARRSPNLVVASVGERSVHRLWIDRDQRTFDLCLIDQGVQPGTHAPDADLHAVRKGSGTECLVALLQDPIVRLAGHRYVLLLEDDVEIDARSIDRLFAMMDAHGLWVAQPSHRSDSHVVWPITAHDPNQLLRFTNFVELGATAFSRDALVRLLPLLSRSRSGWGAGSLVSAVLSDPADRIAVVDAVTCRRPPRERPGTAAAGPRAAIEGPEGLARSWRPGPPIGPRMLGVVGATAPVPAVAPGAGHPPPAGPTAAAAPTAAAGPTAPATSAAHARLRAPNRPAPRPAGRRAPRRPGRLQRALDVATLRGRAWNPLFDHRWYTERYPDVPGSRARAWLHWSRHGWREGRDPNSWFDTDWYVARHPDVGAWGGDPLRHYLLFGRSEGRPTRPA